MKESLTDIGYSITMALDTKKSNLGSQEWLWFHTMLLYYKMQQILYYIKDGTKVYYKMHQVFYYKTEARNDKDEKC